MGHIGKITFSFWGIYRKYKSYSYTIGVWLSILAEKDKLGQMDKGLKHKQILGVNITSNSKKEVLDFISDRLKNFQKTIVFTPNPEILVRARKDSCYRDLLNTSDVNIPDGVGLVRLAKFFYQSTFERMPGRLFVEDLLTIADQNRYRVYILGASREVNDKAKQIISNKYKNLTVQGDSGPLLSSKANIYIDRDKEAYFEIEKNISIYKPHLLFVAYGAPKQEYWIDKNRNLDYCVSMAIGGTLDYMTGKAVLPPTYISRLGLEWLWRVLYEPSRIPRIFNAIIVFPIFVIIDYLLSYLKPRSSSKNSQN